MKFVLDIRSRYSKTVQHERAPRSCVPQSQSALSALHHFGNSRRLPGGPGGMFLPLPMPPTNPFPLPPQSFLLDNPRYFNHIAQGFVDAHNLGLNPMLTGFSTTCLSGIGNSLKHSINSISVNSGINLQSHANNNNAFTGNSQPNTCSITSSVPVNIAKDDEVTSSEEARTHENSKLSNPPPAPAPVVCSAGTPESVYESAAKLLFLAVKWARTIPSFIQLPIRDQAILLEESWAELFVLTAAQWALPIDEEIFPASSVALRVDARKLRDTISRYALLRVDHTEGACLKALVLFRPDIRDLNTPEQISLLQEQTLNLLHERSGGGRLGRLLLLLPAVKSVANPNTLQELLFKRTVGEVAIERLLGDMLQGVH